MNAIFLLIPLSILLAGCFLGAFIWAVRSGQYEGYLHAFDAAAHRMNLKRPA